MNKPQKPYDFLCGLLMAPAMGCCFLLSGCSRSSDPPLPNIVLILADDLGYGDVEVFNPDSKIPTPNLNHMAEDGITFTNAHAPAAVCTPTRYSLLTGSYPWRSRLKQGVLWIWDPPLLEEGELTLGDVLQQRGYHTACIGKWHLGWEWPTKDGLPATLENQGRNVDYERSIGGGPLDQGFDYYFGDDVPGFPPHAFIENDRLQVLPTAWHEAPPGAPGAMAPGWTYEALLPALTEKASEYIENRATGFPDQPFFLFFSLTAPHTPIAPAEPYVGKSGAGRYGDFVYQVDHSVGTVLSRLDRLGIADQTLVIFCSDNGAIPVDGENYAGEFGSIYRFGHRPNGEWRGIKSDAWEGGHRVPMIAIWPGRIDPGRFSGELVSLTDMMATLAAVADTTLPGTIGVDSHNMLPFMLDARVSSPRKHLVTQSGNGILSLQQGPWKLIMSSGGGGSWSKPAGELPYYDTTEGGDWRNIQLYNLENDPGEENNLALSESEIADEMVELLASQIIAGRSTPGNPLTGRNLPPTWEQVSWLNENHKQ